MSFNPHVSEVVVTVPFFTEKTLDARGSGLCPRSEAALGVPTCVPLRSLGTPKAPSHAEDLAWGLRHFPMVLGEVLGGLRSQQGQRFHPGFQEQQYLLQNLKNDKRPRG